MTNDSQRVNRQPEEPSKSISEQAEESSERRLAREYRGELEQLRTLVLYEWDQRKIPPESLSEMSNGLSRIIEGLDRIPSLKEVQRSVGDARRCLHTATDVLEPLGESPLSPDLLKALPYLSEARYKCYDQFAEILQKAVTQLDAFLIIQEL